MDMEFGKENGKVYFVKNGIYGEDIDIEKCIVESKGSISYIENKVVTRKSPYLIKDNNNIVEKISKYIDINIDSMAYLEYDIEKDLKKNKVITVLKKIGKIREEDIEYELIKNVNIIGDDKNRYNYRNKVSLKLEVDEKKGNIIYGYYRKKTNNIVEISDCIVASEKINNVIVILNKYKKDEELIKELIKSDINEIIIRDIEEGIAIYPRIVRLEEILKKEGIEAEIKIFNGLLVDFMYKENVNILIRGLRALSDYEYELQFTLTNKTLAKSEFETVFLTASREYLYLSSSLVKEVALNKGNLSFFVTENVERRLIDKVKK